MYCEQCQEHFTDYLEGSLPVRQCEQMAAHLRDCSACAAELTAFRQTVAALHTLPAARPPEYLLGRISQAVAAQPRPARVWVSWQRVGTVAAAATILVGLWAVFSYQRPGSVTGGVRPARKAVEQVAPLAEREEAPAEDRVALDTVPPDSPPPAATKGGVTASQAANIREGWHGRPGGTQPPQPAQRAGPGAAVESEGASLPDWAAGDQGPNEQVQDGAAGEGDLCQRTFHGRGRAQDDGSRRLRWPGRARRGWGQGNDSAAAA